MNWNFDSEFSLANSQEFGDMGWAFLPADRKNGGAKQAPRASIIIST
jgi:hypothetical protein